MRVVITADTHADERRKWSEHCRVLDWMAEDMRTRQVDLVCHGGDIYDGVSTPTGRKYVADWIQRVAEFAPMCLVAGNHDRHLDVEHIARLRTKYPIIAVERPGVHVVAGVAVAMLPWPRMAHLLAALGRNVGREEAGQVAIEALRSVLTGLGVELARHAGPRILLAHAMVDGSKTDSRQPIMGADLTVSIADMSLCKADIMVAGHVHAEQEMAHAGADLVIPGCPYHRTFGEPGPTSYVVAHFAPDRTAEPPTWERISTPATKMLLLDAEWDTESQALLGHHRFVDVEGCEVRLRYTVPSDQRESSKQRANEAEEALKSRGAVSVKVDEVVLPKTHARVPEVAEAKTLEQKLRALWKARDPELEEARKSRLLGMADELEREAAT